MQSKLQRPLTLVFQVPGLEGNSRANLQAVARELFKTISAEDILCLQPRGASSFQLTLRDEETVIRAQESGLKIRDHVVDLMPVSGGFTYVTITDAPFELQHETIRYALSFYGEVKKIEFVSLGAEFANIKSGDRRVTMVMKKPVPNILSVAGNDLYCWYKKVQKLCRRCGATDHLAAACLAAVPGPRRCQTCNNRWHTTADCTGCAKCRTLAHTSTDCPVKEEPLEDENRTPEPTEATVEPPHSPELPATDAAEVPVNPAAKTGPQPTAKSVKGGKKSPPACPAAKKQKAAMPLDHFTETMRPMDLLFGNKPPPPDHPFFGALERLKSPYARCSPEPDRICFRHNKNCSAIYDKDFMDLWFKNF